MRLIYILSVLIYSRSGLSFSIVTTSNPPIVSYSTVHRICFQLNTTQSRRIISWKRATLGDGGVYWDKRPKSLNALNQALAEHIFHRLQEQENSPGGERSCCSVECAVISTCARFEVVLSAESDVPIENRKDVIIQAVSECLAVQCGGLKRLFHVIIRDDPSRIATKTYFQWLNNTASLEADDDIQSWSWAQRLRSLFTLTFLKECKTLL
jgi:hypothetical protein